MRASLLGWPGCSSSLPLCQHPECMDSVQHQTTMAPSSSSDWTTATMRQFFQNIAKFEALVPNDLQPSLCPTGFMPSCPSCTLWPQCLPSHPSSFGTPQWSHCPQCTSPHSLAWLQSGHIIQCHSQSVIGFGSEFLPATLPDSSRMAVHIVSSLLSWWADDNTSIVLLLLLSSWGCPYFGSHYFWSSSDVVTFFVSLLLPCWPPKSDRQEELVVARKQ